MTQLPEHADTPADFERMAREQAIAMPEGYTGVTVVMVTNRGPSIMVTGPDVPAMLWCGVHAKWERVVEGGMLN